MAKRLKVCKSQGLTMASWNSFYEKLKIFTHITRKIQSTFGVQM
jgi:hypothetical protein